MPVRDSELAVVHIGSATDLVRQAVTAAPEIGGPDCLVSVDTERMEIPSLDRADIRVIVFEVDPASELDRLTDLQAAYPGIPCLAIVPDAAAVETVIATGVTDVFVRRDSINEATLLARRLAAVSATRTRDSIVDESAERLIDTIDDLFYVIDMDGNLVRWNDTFRDIAGYDDSELGEMHALDFFTGFDEARITEAIEKISETGSGSVEAAFVSKDGTSTPIEYTGTLIRDEEGDPQGIVGIGRDVTARREREDQLLRLRQSVETITDNAPLALFEIASDGTVSGVRGDALARCLDQPTVQGMSIDECFPDQSELRSATEAALNGEPNHRLVDIGASTLELWLQPLLEETGTVNRVIGLVLDVTAREERAKMLDQIQANAGEVIWMSTPGKGSMDFITDSYADVWGRPPETLREDPMSFVEAIHHDDRDRVEAALAEQHTDPDAYEETYRVVHPDGTVRWVHDQAAGVYEDGELTRIVGIATDITVRKRREQELELKNRAIETAPVGIAIHSTDEPTRPITYVNEEFESITGYDRDALEQSSVATLAGEDTDAGRIEAIEAALETGAHSSEVAILYRANGVPFWARVDIAPVVGTDGDVTHVVSFLQNVTESKEHEQEIERHLAEFSEVLAEDLGIPLEEAQTHLDTALESGSHEDIQRAAQSVERVLSLVDDLTTVHSFSVKSRRVSEAIRDKPTTEQNE
ncbi:PAS domain S-box protein [Haloarcula sp. S1AR25-5A]|uniref:histidine kinase n=1 Tax=Haloarcula terrestris TaxID=2950533 RepID=A0AAE4F1U8_9EURY|nr:PAS domain S-box protein [Haloarcula terrestris]MDS0222751.1 PAS domain S-box protein [Haloarcula terrestris]